MIIPLSSPNAGDSWRKKIKHILKVLRRIDHRDLLDITKSIPTSLTALNATIFFNGRP